MSKVQQILFFSSNPEGTDRLMLDEEARTIREKIRGSTYDKYMELIPLTAARADDLLEFLSKYKPPIVHFSGHGSKAGELYFMDQNREMKPVNKSALVRVFKSFKKDVRVIFLNACFSNDQAKAIAGTIDFVVGMRSEVGDDSAIAFSGAFYRAIGYGYTIKEAFDQGLASISLEGLPDENVPKLFVREGADANNARIFDKRARRQTVMIVNPEMQEELKVHKYLTERSEAHTDYLNSPKLPQKLEIIGDFEPLDVLRRKLLSNNDFSGPKEITVEGVLYPAALLTSGWWEKKRDKEKEKAEYPLVWRDSVQEWLFSGFDLWAPSWDFTWDIETWGKVSQKRFAIAQIGGGDEADSLPVFIPFSRIPKFRELLDAHNGIMMVQLRAILASRADFCLQTCAQNKAHCTACGRIKMFGGLLDFCLWIDENNADHGIKSCKDAEFYSGYLWKCVSPEQWHTGGQKTISLDQTIFIWEHTNFAKPDAIKYNLEFLEKKEEHFKAKFGNLIYVQKSSPLVPGTPAMAAREVYDLLLAGKKPTLA